MKNENDVMNRPVTTCTDIGEGKRVCITISLQECQGQKGQGPDTEQPQFNLTTAQEYTATNQAFTPSNQTFSQSNQLPTPEKPRRLEDGTDIQLTSNRTIPGCHVESAGPQKENRCSSPPQRLDCPTKCPPCVPTQAKEIPPPPKDPCIQQDTPPKQPTCPQHTPPQPQPCPQPSPPPRSPCFARAQDSQQSSPKPSPCPGFYSSAPQTPRGCSHQINPPQQQPCSAHSQGVPQQVSNLQRSPCSGYEDKTNPSGQPTGQPSSAQPQGSLPKSYGCKPMEFSGCAKSGGCPPIPNSECPFGGSRGASAGPGGATDPKAGASPTKKCSHGHHYDTPLNPDYYNIPQSQSEQNLRECYSQPSFSPQPGDNYSMSSPPSPVTSYSEPSVHHSSHDGHQCYNHNESQQSPFNIPVNPELNVQYSANEGQTLDPQSMRQTDKIEEPLSGTKVLESSISMMEQGIKKLKTVVRSFLAPPPADSERDDHLPGCPLFKEKDP